MLVCLRMPCMYSVSIGGGVIKTLLPGPQNKRKIRSQPISTVGSTKSTASISKKKKRALAGGASSSGLVPKRSRSGASSSSAAAVASSSSDSEGEEQPGGSAAEAEPLL